MAPNLRAPASAESFPHNQTGYFTKQQTNPMRRKLPSDTAQKRAEPLRNQCTQ